MSINKHSHCLVYCPFSNQTEALSIAEILLKSKLIACANIYPGVISRYWWQGKIENSSECVALFKTRSDLFKKTQKTIEENHSYSQPAILKLPIDTANPLFSNWIDQTVQRTHKQPLKRGQKTKQKSSTLAESRKLK